MFYVYILRSIADRKLYIGYTESDPLMRLKKHNEGSVASTKNRKPLELVYYEYYLNQADALGREKFLKSGSGHRYINKQMSNYFKENA